MADTEMVPEAIVITYGDKKYTLGFDRASVAVAERTYRFNISELLHSVMLSQMQDMFAAAFIKNHRNVSRSLINEIYNRMSRKADLYEQLVLMYIDVANSVLDVDAEDEDAEGNGVAWEAI